MKGKLKRSLKERCPECGKVLQLRVLHEESMRKGIPIIIEIEYICCSNKSCFYKRNIEQKRRRIREEDIVT